MVDGEQEGKDLLIAFNANYLREGIRAFNDMEVVMNFSGPLRACVIEGVAEENDYLYVGFFL